MSGRCWLWLACGVVAIPGVRADERLTYEQAETALHRAVTFFHERVSDDGGYLWRYSGDLRYREGEGAATETQSWVQPPGTPSVGDALLTAWELTGDPLCRRAAIASGRALVRGQLVSGGWDYRIESDPEQRKRYRYRVEPSGANGRNVTTLDDNTTQSAVRFLMRVDASLEFRDAAIHEAVTAALESLLQAQYPNGAWPQRYSEPPNPDEFPVRAASYPEDWPREWPDRRYAGFYTFNDNTMADMIDVMFAASEAYRDPRFREAAERAGGFILLAQMPEPQPAWAQQYNVDMQPAWARKFEPPAVTGGESQGVLRILLRLYEKTGDRRYLEPVPRAIAYLRASERPDGRLARFYELQTNRPLYFTQDYQLTWDDNDLPTHYAFIVGSGVDRIERDYRRLLAEGPPDGSGSSTGPRRAPRLTDALTKRAADIVAALDDRGAWTQRGSLRRAPESGTGQPVIETRTFIRNLVTLAEWMAAVSRESQSGNRG